MQLSVLLGSAGSPSCRPRGLPANAAAAGVDSRLVQALAAAAPAVNGRVLGLAVAALACAERGTPGGARRLAVIDYSLPSTQPRLWLFDLEARSMLLEEHVAHGRGCGENYAFRFSNEPDREFLTTSSLLACPADAADLSAGGQYVRDLESSAPATSL